MVVDFWIGLRIDLRIELRIELRIQLRSELRVAQGITREKNKTPPPFGKVPPKNERKEGGGFYS